MTAKAKLIDSSDDEVEDENVPETEVLETALKIAESNPWSLEVSTEVNSFIDGFKKFNQKNKDIPEKAIEIVDATEENKKENSQLNSLELVDSITKKSKRSTKRTSQKWDVSVATEKPSKPVTDFNIDDAFFEVDKKLKENIEAKFTTLKGKVTPLKKVVYNKKSTKKMSLKMKPSRWHVERVNVDEELGDKNVEEDQQTKRRKLEELPDADKEKNPYDVTGKNSEVNIDPDVYLKIQPKVMKSSVPDDVDNGDEEAMDDGESQQQVIMEAFADDNVTDFRYRAHCD